MSFEELNKKQQDDDKLKSGEIKSEATDDFGSTINKKNSDQDSYQNINKNINKKNSEITDQDQDQDTIYHQQLIKYKLIKSEILEWVFIVIISLIIVFVLRTFIIATSMVSGDSMLPSLHNNDYLFVRKIAYVPRRGDILIFRKNGDVKTLVKRVIGVAGDTIDIDRKSNKVVLNNKIMDENYINGVTYSYENSNVSSSRYPNLSPLKFPVTVPDGKVFVLGDNRVDSVDSRLIGFIDIKTEVKGKVSFRLWPFHGIGVVK